MHGAIRSTSSSTSQARSGVTGTVKEWSISMLIVCHSLWRIQSVNYARYRSATAKTPRRRKGGPVGRTRGSAGVQHLEALGQPALGQARPLAREREPRPEAFGQVVQVPGLALVRAQRRHLAREGVGHVDVVVGGRPARDPDLAHGPGGQRLAIPQLGE